MEQHLLQLLIGLLQQKLHQNLVVQREGPQVFCPPCLKTISTTSFVFLSFKQGMERENECKQRDTVDLIDHIRHWSKKNNPSNSTGWMTRI